MPDEQRIPDNVNEEAQAEWAVLNLLIDSTDQRPWSLDEIVRERGNHIDAIDATDRLYAAGLIHRTTDGFVFATRAAIRFSQIVG
jgi:hypothetical protein